MLDKRPAYRSSYIPWSTDTGRHQGDEVCGQLDASRGDAHFERSRLDIVVHRRAMYAIYIEARTVYRRRLGRLVGGCIRPRTEDVKWR